MLSVDISSLTLFELGGGDQKSTSPVGFSSINFYVVPLLPWNFLLIFINLLSRGKFLGSWLVPDPSYRPRLQTNSWNLFGQILIKYKLVKLFFYMFQCFGYGHQILKTNVNTQEKWMVSFYWHVGKLSRHDGFFKIRFVHVAWTFSVLLVSAKCS